MKNEHFPDCTILTMPQRSEAWFTERLGKLTASQIGSWLTDKGQSKRTMDARANAANKLLAQEMGEVEPSPIPKFDIGDPEPTSPFHHAIWAGVQREPDARELFENIYLVETKEVGFCRHKSGIAGCSPDALMGDGTGLEIKCPKLETHLGYLDDDQVPSKYLNQIHFSMATTGAHGWWFMSYHPMTHPLTIYVERDGYTDDMVDGIESFKKYLTMRRDKLKEQHKKFQEL